jgi:hypothetical protein
MPSTGDIAGTGSTTLGARSEADRSEPTAAAAGCCGEAWVPAVAEAAAAAATAEAAASDKPARADPPDSEDAEWADPEPRLQRETGGDPDDVLFVVRRRTLERRRRDSMYDSTCVFT